MGRNTAVTAQARSKLKRSPERVHFTAARMNSCATTHSTPTTISTRGAPHLRTRSTILGTPWADLYSFRRFTTRRNRRHSFSGRRNGGVSESLGKSSTYRYREPRSEQETSVICVRISPLHPRSIRWETVLLFRDFSTVRDTHRI